MTDALRVLLQACGNTFGPTINCNFGGNIPYVEVEPAPSYDTITVRVGLRVEAFCESSESYVVVLGDTVKHNSLGWADFAFSRKRIRQLDTLRVESCTGSALTGEHSCVHRNVAMTW